MKILTAQYDTILREERIILNNLLTSLVKFQADDADTKALLESISQLDELFLLVIVGEFNSGKSAFINALLGDRFLEEGVTPTTSQINLLRFGRESQRTLIKRINW